MNHKIRENRPILILLAVGFLIGIATVRQYGESWDELQFFKYADHALQAYGTWPRTGDIPLTGNTYDNYGPAYVMAVALGARLLGLVIPWITSDLRHLLYFLTYLASIWAFYEFSKRWLSGNAAFGATLLFSTQPLFWGHTFISPKDIPFLAFFLLSLEFGFRMADSLVMGKDQVSTDSPLPVGDREAPRAQRVGGLGMRAKILTALWLLVVFGLFAATPLVRTWIYDLVHAAASGQTNIVSHIASDIHTAQPEIYAQRYFVFFLWARSTFVILSSFLMYFLFLRRSPAALRSLSSILPAAILLGVTTSIRVFGPLAGLIVTGYALWKSGRKSLLALIAYAIVALITMYLTWPYLWLDPIGHFVESLRVMSTYPWQGQVLFNGVFYQSTQIPRAYLPVLLGIQLTEPVWILFAIGLTIAAYESIKARKESRALLLLTLIWFIIPLLGFVVSRAPLYDNFRQIFFILPPVFLIAGVVFEKIERPILQAILIGLLVLPGIVDGASLHPYEYIYYNRFIGGVQGTFRKYELDYWGTSYREAADYLNHVASANATIWVEGPAHLLQLYARPDLKIYSTYEAARADHYDYVVALTRYNLDLQSYPSAQTIHIIEREGAILTVIKAP